MRTLKRIFGKPMTLVALRHSYTSSVIDYNKPIRELRAIATSMGHSVSAQKMYQWTGEKNEVMVDADPASV